MALPITVQWNTHKESGGVPVFGLNTKQKFAPQPLDNVLDQGQFDIINPNKFRGQRTHGELNFRQDASEQWANNISWAGAGSPPQATYQGANVNFSQSIQKKPKSVFNKSIDNSIVIPTRDYTKHGCSCPNCKNGIGECSDKCSECNAWDLGCEANCGIEGIQTDVVNWGKDTTETFTDFIEDTRKTITDPIIDPIASLKYLPLIAVGGIAAYLLTRKK